MDYTIELKDVNGQVHVSDVFSWDQEAYDFNVDRLKHWPDLYHITFNVSVKETIFNPKQIILARVLAATTAPAPAAGVTAN